MYQAEEIIAKELARLASAPPKIVKHNIANWIKKNEATECNLSSDWTLLIV